MEASVFAVMQECFTRPRFSTGAQPRPDQFRCRQCTDVADYFVEIGPNFRFPVWESYNNLFTRLDESKASTSSSPNISTPSFPLQAIQQFCRAVKEAEAFLQDHCCTFTGRHDWLLCAKGLSQLDTKEAYDVYLHNMIWSKTGLEIALLYYYAAAVAANTKSGSGSTQPHRPEHLSEHVQMLVTDNKTILRRYSSAYKERQTLMDRFDFHDLVGNCITAKGNGSGVDKYLSLLLSVSSQALPGKNAEQQLPDQVLIDGLEITEEATVIFSKEEETIGEGAYSKRVYGTWWLDGKMAVAVKVISLEYYSAYDSEEELAGELAELQESDEEDPAEKNFKDEVSLLASLHSPYIVRLLGWAIDKKRKEGKLVTELVATDLGKVLEAPENKKGLAFDVALDLMLQLSKALEYVHAQNVIHRDIKPSNILLQPVLGSAHSTSSRDQFWRVKLCDFGIAKKRLPQGAMSSARYSTFKMGTQWYRSPEVLSEQVKYSNKADVYSFAITCAEMLGGYSATVGFGRGEGSLLNKIQNNQRPSLSTSYPNCISDLIRKCWLTDPHKRPSFRIISSMLTYIKFLLVPRCPVGKNFNAVSHLLITPFDEYELKACMSGVAQVEAARSIGSDHATMWLHSEALALKINRGPDPVDQLKVPYQLKSPDTQARRIIRRWLQSEPHRPASLRVTESLVLGQYQLTMQENGNLVLLDCEQLKCLWASGHTSSRSISGYPFVCTLTSSGNLVVHSGRQELWSSRTAWVAGAAGALASYKLELTLDGRAVIRGPNGAGVVWATERKSMSSGDVLHFDHELRNHIGYHFVMQSDGNLVLYDEQHRAQWASGTYSHDNGKRCRCTLQNDGILVIFKGDSDVVWTSDNQPCSNPTLELQSDGNVVITDDSGRLVWQTSTGHTDDYFMINAAYY